MHYTPSLPQDEILPLFHVLLRHGQKRRIPALERRLGVSHPYSLGFLADLCISTRQFGVPSLLQPIFCRSAPKVIVPPRCSSDCVKDAHGCDGCFERLKRGWEGCERGEGVVAVRKRVQEDREQKKEALAKVPGFIVPLSPGVQDPPQSKVEHIQGRTMVTFSPFRGDCIGTVFSVYVSNAAAAMTRPTTQGL